MRHLTTLFIPDRPPVEGIRQDEICWPDLLLCSSLVSGTGKITRFVCLAMGQWASVDTFTAHCKMRLGLCKESIWREGGTSNAATRNSNDDSVVPPRPSPHAVPLRRVTARQIGTCWQRRVMWMPAATLRPGRSFPRHSGCPGSCCVTSPSSQLCSSPKASTSR